jgi:hypothetical protein
MRPSQTSPHYTLEPPVYETHTHTNISHIYPIVYAEPVGVIYYYHLLVFIIVLFFIYPVVYA